MILRLSMWIASHKYRCLPKSPRTMTMLPQVPRDLRKRSLPRRVPSQVSFLWRLEEQELRRALPRARRKTRRRPASPHGVDPLDHWAQHPQRSLPLVLLLPPPPVEPVWLPFSNEKRSNKKRSDKRQVSMLISSRIYMWSSFFLTIYFLG